MSEWISVENRLPDFAETVIFTDGESVKVGRCYKKFNGGWHDQLSHAQSVNNVTHWMPLPEPPKEVPHDGKAG